MFPLIVDDIEWPVTVRDSSVNESSSSMRIFLAVDNRWNYEYRKVIGIKYEYYFLIITTAIFAKVIYGYLNFVFIIILIFAIIRTIVRVVM